MVSRCTMRCARRRKNTWLSIGLAPLVSWCSPCESCRNTRSRSEEYPSSMPPSLPYPTAQMLTQRHAELCRDLPPAKLQRLLDDQLGDVGEPVAHLHQRQDASEVRHRHAEQGGALELPQRLDLLLRAGQLFEARTELARHVAARRQLRQQALIDQLIEQQRVCGDLRGEEV